MNQISLSQTASGNLVRHQLRHQRKEKYKNQKTTVISISFPIELPETYREKNLPKLPNENTQPKGLSISGFRIISMTGLFGRMNEAGEIVDTHPSRKV